MSYFLRLLKCHPKFCYFCSSCRFPLGLPPMLYPDKPNDSPRAKTYREVVPSSLIVGNTIHHKAGTKSQGTIYINTTKATGNLQIHNLPSLMTDVRLTIHT